VIFGLRDGDEIIATAPLVVAVAAAEEPAGGGEAQAATAPAVEPQAAFESSSGGPAAPPAPAAVLDSQPATDFASATPIAATREQIPAVGTISDPVYPQIESLLFAPASTHAPRFLERYEEAVREFRERYSPPPEESPEARLTDDDMARYNESLHAWLDADERRIATIAADEAWDFGGIQTAWLASGAGYERILGNSADAFARPGLPAVQGVQAQPGLKEGLVSLS
jgi:hypothetical protein